MTPEDATHEHNEFQVKTNLLLTKVHTRKYPELRVGDRVKIYKKRSTFAKERDSVWDPTVRQITGIVEQDDQTLFRVSGVGNLVIRSNILKL